jgi:hypothetical protein
MVSVMAMEGAAVTPVAMLGGLWAVAVLAWLRPRHGALALVALGAWSLWFFHDPAGRYNIATWMIALPAWAIAVLGWLGAPRHDRPRTGPQAA